MQTTKTRRPDLTDAIKRGLPTRWVLRQTIGDEQWAILVECGPGPGPGVGGFMVQMLREINSPAYKLDWSRYDAKAGLDFNTKEGLLHCDLTLVAGLEDGLATLADIEGEGFRWDGTVYEPDRSKLELGVIEWKPWKEGAKDD